MLSDYFRVTDPAVNTMDQTSNELGSGSFSPIQQWERYVHAPEMPTIIINFSLSAMLKDIVDILTKPELAKPLSKFLKGVTE